MKNITKRNVLIHPEWMHDSAKVRDRFRFLQAVLDERSRRLLAAAESKAWGRGGISAVPGPQACRAK